MLARDDMKSDRLLPLKKALVRTMAVIAIMCLIYTAYLYYDYPARMPNEPQPETGRTYPVVLKNHTFYTTRTEQRRYYTTQYIFFACMITFVTMSWIQSRRSRSGAA